MALAGVVARVLAGGVALCLSVAAFTRPACGWPPAGDSGTAESPVREFEEVGHGEVDGEKAPTMGESILHLSWISEELESNPRFSTFSRVIEEAGAGFYLEQSRDVTVFAPINEAFAELDFDYFALPWELQWKILSYHVVPGEVIDIASVAEETPMKLKSWHGDSLGLRVDPFNRLGAQVTDNSPSYFVGDAKVLDPQEGQELQNGKIFAISKVLIPKSLEKELLEYAEAQDRDRATLVSSGSLSPGEVRNSGRPSSRGGDRVVRSQRRSRSRGMVAHVPETRGSTLAPSEMAYASDTLQKTLKRSGGVGTEVQHSSSEGGMLEGAGTQPRGEMPEFVREINRHQSRWSEETYLDSFAKDALASQGSVGVSRNEVGRTGSASAGSRNRSSRGSSTETPRAQRVSRRERLSRRSGPQGTSVSTRNSRNSSGRSANGSSRSQRESRTSAGVLLGAASPHSARGRSRNRSQNRRPTVQSRSH